MSMSDDAEDTGETEDAVEAATKAPEFSESATGVCNPRTDSTYQRVAYVKAGKDDIRISYLVRYANLVRIDLPPGAKLSDYDSGIDDKWTRGSAVIKSAPVGRYAIVARGDDNKYVTYECQVKEEE
jgi:hypothetical protein